MERLLAAARAYYGADAGTIVAAAGTQQLIQVLPQVLAGRRISIAEPTYSEHAKVWAAAGREIVGEDEPADIAVIVNPNNPDGRIRPLPKAPVVIVDEAFCDVMPEASAIGSGAIVLRSFGKFFGLAGLRLGFAIAAPDISVRLNEALGPWAVSGPAIEVGTRALSDAAWIEKNRNHLKDLRQKLDAVLEGVGLKIVGGTNLFRLVEDRNAAALHTHLGRVGILVRAFAGQPSWLRFGLPGRDKDFARLAQALSSR
jgi:cobalamin biosynthetic protein CobC